MHHVAKLFVALALSVLAIGCSSTHETVSATSGVYDLTIASDHDACSPLRATGPMGSAAVVQQGGSLTLTAPDLTSSSPMLVAFDGATGYANQRSEMLAPCTDATLDRSYTILASGPGGFDVAYRESWSGMSTCGAAMRSIMPAAPTGDCSADLVLHYRLQAECASPCQIFLQVDGSAACHC